MLIVDNGIIHVASNWKNLKESHLKGHHAGFRGTRLASLKDRDPLTQSNATCCKLCDWLKKMLCILFNGVVPQGVFLGPL